MAKQNPRIVTNAILQNEISFGKVTIGPVTIWKYALLEKLESPFLFADKEFTVENVAPTIFVLAKERSELKPLINDFEKLKDEALEFVDDNLSLEDLPKAIQAVVDQFLTLNKAAPADSAEKK